MRFIVGCCLFLVTHFSFAQLPIALEEMLTKHHVDKNDLSLIVEPLNSDQAIASLNPEVSRSPASITKLFTTAAGLIRLGPNYTWKTKFYVDELPDQYGVVNGNLYIKGGGDPFLVEEYLLEMLQALKAKGVDRIAGDIILDRSMYHLTEAQVDRASFDGNQWSAYNAVPDPLMVNFRTVTFTVEPINKNAAKVTIHPDFLNWKINNQLQVNNGTCTSKNYHTDVDISRDDRGYAEVSLKGKYTPRCGKQELSVVMGDPSEQFYYLFRVLAMKAGIDFQGAGKVITKIPKSAKLFYEGQTKPLSEQIQMMNQLSNNVMTRQLFLTLGVDTYGETSNLEKARKAVMKTLSAFGINTRDLFIDNGSGLSRETHITAAALADLLQKMAQSSHGLVFENSLSIAGHNGTLKRRYRGEALDGKVHGKTGTMNQVRSFAGYVYAKNGQKYVVVIIGNGPSALRSRALQDDILKWVYNR